MHNAAVSDEEREVPAYCSCHCTGAQLYEAFQNLCCRSAALMQAIAAKEQLYF
jgi:hypothetical protein